MSIFVKENGVARLIAGAQYPEVAASLPTADGTQGLVQTPSGTFIDFDGTWTEVVVLTGVDGDLALANTVVSGGHLAAAFDLVDAGGNAGSSLALTWESYAAATRVANSNCTVSWTWPTMSTDEMYSVQLTLVATGNRAYTWPAEVKWAGDESPPIDSGQTIDIILQRRYRGGWLVRGAWATHTT